MTNISIHALREEGDPQNPASAASALSFLSTPSARRATGTFLFSLYHTLHFYPRPPRGGRPPFPPQKHLGIDISIHALREEGDLLRSLLKCWSMQFLSTPSARRATTGCHGLDRGRGISIHALREEGDLGDLLSLCLQHISIHALREEGDKCTVSPMEMTNKFLSTPSARRATCRVFLRQRLHNAISIHALREEGDAARCCRAAAAAQFLSTPSARRATGRNLFGRQQLGYFYPRPPRGGRQQKQRENPLLLSHYTPLCTNCKEVPVKQTAKSHRYLCKRLVFRCEASGKTMCAAGSHWRGIKRSAHYPAQTPGAAQHARP